MLEDACLVGDTALLPSLFDDDAVILAEGTSQVRGALRHRRGDHRPSSTWRQLRRRTALVIQSGRLALIISGTATSVVRRGPDGWHYVISRLDLCRPF
jgi:hypothetical protein